MILYIMQLTSGQKILPPVSLVFRILILYQHINRKGTQDCGLYSISIFVSLAFNLELEQLKFDQSAMRDHLINCIETEKFLPFSAVTELL